MVTNYHIVIQWQAVVKTVMNNILAIYVTVDS